MNDQIKESLKEYEEIKLQMKRLDEKLEVIKPFILENLPEGTDIQTDFGKFSSQSRSKWTFSDSITSMAKQLKDGQAGEKADGTAKEEKGTPYIVYKENK